MGNFFPLVDSCHSLLINIWRESKGSGIGRRKKNNWYRQKKTHKCSFKVQRLFNFHPWQSQVCSVSLPGTPQAIQKHFYKLGAPSEFWARRRQSMAPIQKHWDLAVRNRQFLKHISMRTARRHQEKLVWLGQKEPLVTCCCIIITWLFVPCPGLPPQLAPPSGSVCRRQVLARFYPTRPCHRPDQASHVTWSHLWQDLSVSKYCISRARTNSPSVA